MTPMYRASGSGLLEVQPTSPSLRGGAGADHARSKSAGKGPPSSGLVSAQPADGREPLPPRDFQMAMDRMLSLTAHRQRQTELRGKEPLPGKELLSPAASDAQREASMESLATALMQCLEDETAVLRTTPSSKTRGLVGSDLEQMLDQLRRQEAELVAELHRTRLERQVRLIQGELETENLLAQLQQAQLHERHQELRGELQRAEGRPESPRAQHGLEIPQQQDQLRPHPVPASSA